MYAAECAATSTSTGIDLRVRECRSIKREGEQRWQDVPFNSGLHASCNARTHDAAKNNTTPRETQRDIPSNEDETLMIQATIKVGMD
jgi:hypothetical protein